MSDKLISIVLPTYNGAKFIREALDSILNQTYTYWELIVIDDCSTDDTADIVKSYLNKDNRISYYKNEINMKQAYSLNRGFSFAKGEYLTWTSDDNILLSSCLEKLINFLLFNQDVDLCYGNMLLVNEKEPLYSYSTFDRFVRETKEYGKIANLNECTVGGAFLYRRKVYEEIGDYTIDSNFYLIIDYEYWLRINNKFKIMPIDSNEFIYYYRLHEEQLTSKNFLELVYQTIVLKIQYLKYYELSTYSLKLICNKILGLFSYIKNNSNNNHQIYIKSEEYLRKHMSLALFEVFYNNKGYDLANIITKLFSDLIILFDDNSIVYYFSSYFNFLLVSNCKLLKRKFKGKFLKSKYMIVNNFIIIFILCIPLKKLREKLLKKYII